MFATAAAVGIDWQQLLAVQGPLYVVFGILVYFVLRYGPGLVTSHREFLTKLTDSQDKTAQCLDTLTETVGDIHAKTDQTKSGIKHLALAGVSHRKGKDSDVLFHLRNAAGAAGGEVKEEP